MTSLQLECMRPQRWELWFSVLVY